MSAFVAIDAWELPDDCSEVLAVFVDGVELSRDDWLVRGTRLHLRTAIDVAPARRGEMLVEALAWIGRYPPRPTVAALVRRPCGTDVVEAMPAA